MRSGEIRTNETENKLRIYPFQLKQEASAHSTALHMMMSKFLFGHSLWPVVAVFVVGVSLLFPALCLFVSVFPPLALIHCILF